MANCFRTRPAQTNANLGSSKASKSTVELGPTRQRRRYQLGPFCSNQWRSTKYSLWNFLPKNLFEQFRRFANLYFLIAAIVQVSIPYSPVSPATSFVPLVFVITTTLIKQAYEDYLRHKLDREINNRVCHIYRNKRLRKIRAKEIRVGDIVYVRHNEEIPCDMILLSTSGHEGRCYITTSNLDGETNLKSRSCFNVREQLGPIAKIDERLLVIECDRPNATLYEFNGNLRATASSQAYDRLVANLASVSQCNKSPNHQHDDDEDPDGTDNEKWLPLVDRLMSLMQPQNVLNLRRAVVPKVHVHSLVMPQQQLLSSQLSGSDCFRVQFDISNLLLRASRLKNTAHIYGLAIYTGADTKLALNSRVMPNKLSSLESRLNVYLFVGFAILCAMTITSTLMYEKPRVWYLRDLVRHDSLGQMFLAHFLLYNYLVPISLYVTMEFIKFFGTMSVLRDAKMRYAAMGMGADKVLSSLELRNAQSALEASQEAHERAGKSLSSVATKSGTKSAEVGARAQAGPKCNSSDLNEELGQIEVLFSDKTGTLTENKMLFMACSIEGSLYRSLREELYLQPDHMYLSEIPDVVGKIAKVQSNRSVHLSSQSVSMHSGGANSPESASTNSRSASSRSFDHRAWPELSKLELVDDLEKHEQVVEFFICLCLCSTATLNEGAPLEECLPNNMSADYDFTAASPDEESLITAANRFGISLCKATDRECYIVIRRAPRWRKSPEPQPSKDKPSEQQQNSRPSLRTHKQQTAQSSFIVPSSWRPMIETSNSNERYIVRHFQRLHVIEFNSARKRMSVIYRDCDANCILMVSKGSEELLDCLRLDNLSSSGERRANATLAHFEAFARSGLRTMLVARRVLDEQEYLNVTQEIRDARLALDNRQYLLEKIYERVESNLLLIGATAVEDTLQEGVPATIASLKEAGISVWLLTGDKVETAVSAAYLCMLLERDMRLFYLVRQRDAASCKSLIESFVLALKRSSSRTTSEQGQETALKTPRGYSIRRLNLGKLTSTSNQQVASDRRQQLAASRPRVALVADGRSLYYALKYSHQELAMICKRCVCVLACRLSPLQKAEIVRLIKSGPDGPVTAAIGDGANDVSMIQEAHIGIGIMGKEGRQAMNSSDFAISRFCMLNRLLFVHGHLFYHRAVSVIHYFFYKSVMMVVPQFIYSFYSLSSAQTLYHPLLLIGYNLFFTSWPIIMYGLFEEHLPERILESQPALYSANRGNHQMRIAVYLGWLLLGATQGSLIFMLLTTIWGSHTPFLESGKMANRNGFPLKLYFCIIFTSTLDLYLSTNSRNKIFYLAIMVSWFLLPVVLQIYSFVDWSAVATDNQLYGVVGVYLRSTNFWMAVMAGTLSAILPSIALYVRRRINHHRWLRSNAKQVGDD